MGNFAENLNLSNRFRPPLRNLWGSTLPSPVTPLPFSGTLARNMLCCLLQLTHVKKKKKKRISKSYPRKHNIFQIGVFKEKEVEMHRNLYFEHFF